MQPRKTLIALFLCLISAAAAFAQFDTAAVPGTVRDPDGAAISEVVVELRNTATGRVLTTRTDASGSYIFLSVPIGRYQATTAKPEFLRGESELFDLTVNARQRVDFEMYPATAQATTVDVTGEASLVESDSSDRSQVVNTKQILELPLNGRAYSELNYLAPGIVPSPSAGDEFNDREGSFVANGLRSVFNNYLLDGLDNNYCGTSNQGFSNQVTQLPPGAVAGFRVVTNNMSAEYGRAGGPAAGDVLSRPKQGGDPAGQPAVRQRRA